MVQPVIFDVFDKQLQKLFISDEYTQKIKKLEPEITALNGNFTNGVKRVTFDTPDEKYVSAFYSYYDDINGRYMFQLLSFKQIGNVSNELKPLSFAIHINAAVLSNVKDKSTDIQFEELKKHFSKHLSLLNFKRQKHPVGQHFDIYKTMKMFINESCTQINNNVPNFKFSESEFGDLIKKRLISSLFNKL